MKAFRVGCFTNYAEHIQAYVEAEDIHAAMALARVFMEADGYIVPAIKADEIDEIPSDCIYFDVNGWRIPKSDQERRKDSPASVNMHQAVKHGFDFLHMIDRMDDEEIAGLVEDLFATQKKLVNALNAINCVCAVSSPIPGSSVAIKKIIKEVLEGIKVD